MAFKFEAEYSESERQLVVDFFNESAALNSYGRSIQGRGTTVVLSRTWQAAL